MKRLIAAVMMAAMPALADGDRAGEFDYYVLALSWTPTWCALEGDARGSGQCDPGQGFGFTLHGLWPQYETGWPDFCPTTRRAPPRSLTARQAGLYGSSGLAWHQWNKHGTCTGLEAADYYRLSRLAYDRINRPEVLRKLDRAVTLPARVVEEAFLEANPQLQADQVTVTCRDRRIREVRICLTRDLEPRRCGADVIRDCTQTDALLEPIR